MRILTIAAMTAALSMGGPAFANSISEVEGARAHERQGAYLTRQEREMLRRHGSNDDGFYSGRYGYGFGPSVGIYAGPAYGWGYGYDRRGYYGPYGY